MDKMQSTTERKKILMARTKRTRRHSGEGPGSTPAHDKRRYPIARFPDGGKKKRSKVRNSSEETTKMETENVGTENLSNLQTGDAEAAFDSELLSPEEVKSEIIDILDDWQKPITHALGKMDETIPLPNLVIDGFGCAPLPVNGAVACELMKFLERSPYGRGEKTITDPEYRNSFQIGPEKFQIKNPKFTEAVNKIVGKVAEEFYFSPSSVSAKLYKFLLYEPGGLFKPHKDTEKDDGMFATLIIQLPSVFTGGQFRVEHNGRTKMFDLSCEGSNVNSFYIAHFASCTHELTRIESGYRTALVYNLCWTGNATLPPALSENLAETEILRQLIRAHLEETGKHDYRGDAEGSLIWALEHTYTDKALETHGSKALKGKDAFVFKQLMETNESQEEKDMLEIVVAELTKQEQGMCRTHCYWESKDECEWDEEWECYDGDINLANFICLSRDKPESVRFPCNINPEKDIVNYDEDWGEITREKCEGPSGNEGATMDRWYSRRLLIAYRKSM